MRRRENPGDFSFKRLASILGPMKDEEKMLQPERFTRIQELLAQRHIVKVAELSSEMGVSENTIRRDLMALEEAGICFRTKGGAGLLQSSLSGAAFSRRLSRNRGNKHTIARKAAELVKSGDTVIIDTGTTALEAALALRDKEHITVITPSLEAAQVLAGLPDLTLIVAGGIVHGPSRSMTGSPAEEFFTSLHADLLFLSAKGVSLDKGLTDHTMVEASVKRRMIEAAEKIVLLADHSKLDRTALSPLAGIDVVHTLITDEDADPVFLEALRKRGIEVVKAPAEE